jgi:hypothetical protein
LLKISKIFLKILCTSINNFGSPGASIISKTNKIFEFLGRCFFEKKYPEKLTLNWKSIITRRACGKRRVDLIRQFREFIGLKIGMLSCRFRARPVGDCFAEDEFFDSPVVITATPKVCR